jgi:hypothetical protein
MNDSHIFRVFTGQLIINPMTSYNTGCRGVLLSVSRPPVSLPHTAEEYRGLRKASEW